MSTEPDVSKPARKGTSLATRFAIAFLAGVVLVAGVGGAGLYVYGEQFNGRILPGVTVGGTDLSGLTPEQATAALDKAYGDLSTGRVLVAGPDGELTIGFSEIGRRADTAAIVEAALAAGRAGDPIRDLVGIPQTALNGVTINAAVTYDSAKLADAVAQIAKGIDRDAVDATLTEAEDGTFVTTASQDGRVVDQAALVAAIDAQIASLDAPAEVRLDLPMTTQPAARTTDQVEAAKATAERMVADIVFTRGTDSWTIPSDSLRPLVSFQQDTMGALVPVVDEAGIDPLLVGIEKAVNQDPAEPTFLLHGAGVVVGNAGKEGRKLDIAATHQLVVDTLMARQSGIADGALEPVLATAMPQITPEQAAEWAPKMVEISRWRTWFPIWVRNGYGANIWVPSKLINGYVVAPGAKFDFWKVVGPVTLERGFRPGNAIINGKTDPLGAMGGGICTCSTTLFNAALRAGFKMGARRNHYYYINRYPKGLDATVFISGGSVQTMSWTNDTDYPVLIRGINTRSGNIGYVTFVLYSIPTGRTVKLDPAVVKNFKEAPDNVEYTSTLPAGKKVRVEVPEDGMDVWRKITVYNPDGTVLRTTTYYSHYSVVPGLLQVGTGGGPAPTPTPKPSPTPTPSP